MKNHVIPQRQNDNLLTNLNPAKMRFECNKVQPKQSFELNNPTMRRMHDSIVKRRIWMSPLSYS